MLVHVGDLLQHGGTDELVLAADWLASLPHRRKIVVAGNHEVCLERRPAEARPILERIAGLTYLEDSAVTLDGLLFYGSPWQPRFRIWAFGAARGPELAAKWAKIPDQVDVLVTHGPPRGFGDRIRASSFARPGLRPDPRLNEERRVGCSDLLARVRQVKPRLHLFGHIHQDPGRWEEAPTTFANVTTDEGALPASVFDL